MGNASSLKHHLETAEKTGVLQLSKSNLREIPKDLIENGHCLRTLDLNTNRLHQLTDSIGAFVNLKSLNVSYNKLKAISPLIGKLTKLETLNLEGNMLDTLPDELENLGSLKNLNLAKNRFKKFPIQICSPANLEVIVLSNNEIEEIPDEISQSNANEINLNHNKLAKLNDSLAKCQKLKILRLANNQLQVGAITKTILADSKICLLSLENNLFTLNQLQGRDGYEQYGERYTSTKRKLI